MASPTSSVEQRAAKRKSHRKSRNGCYQCKQRHSKCNEVHPRCANCVRLDIDCTWPARERYSTTYPTPPANHGTAFLENHLLPDADQTADTFGSEMSMADLRLLHHWTTKTCDSLSPEPKKCDAWRITHVEIALDHPFLLRGLLAIAAAHKVLTDAHADRTSLLLQANVHISKALATYRQNLEQPKAESAIAMFILSTVLVIYHLATARLEATPEDPVNAMAHCFRLIQGVLVVINSKFDELTSNKVFTDMLVSQEPPIKTEPIEEIVRLKRLTETKKTPAGALYIEAIDQLHISYQKTRQVPADADRLSVAFSWSTSLSDPFTRRLSAHDPIAVLILAHFAALLAECQNSWWIRELPQRVVFAAQKLLMSTPELLDYLDWPLQMITAHAGT